MSGIIGPSSFSKELSLSPVPDQRKEVPDTLDTIPPSISTLSTPQTQITDFLQRIRNNIHFFPPTTDETWIKMVSNFAGGGILTGPKNIDGLKTSLNFSTWQWLFGIIAQSPFLQLDQEGILHEITQGVTQLLNYARVMDHLNAHPEALATKSQEIAEQIYSLQPGKWQCIYGGWGSRDGLGHVYVYKFARVKDKYFDIYIYTSTAFELAHNCVIGDKIRTTPVVLFKDVPEEKILFNENKAVNGIFIQACMEPFMLHLVSANFRFDVENVLAIFRHIDEYRVCRSPLAEYGAITGQRGATCVPSSTKVWIRDQSQSQHNYKLIMVATRLILLYATHCKLRKHINADTEMGSQTRHLLEMVACTMLRTIGKSLDATCQNGRLIDPAFANMMLEIGQDLLSRVQKGAETVTVSRHRALTSLDVDKDVTSQKTERAKKQWKVGETRYCRNTVRMRCPLPKLNLSIGNDVDQLIRSLRTACNAQTNLLKIGAGDLANLQLHHIIDELPFPEISEAPPQKKTEESHWVDSLKGGLWDHVNDRATLEESLQLLICMASQYAPDSNSDVATRGLTTIFAIQGIIHFLSLKLDKLNDNKPKEARLGYYKIPCKMDLTNQIEGLTFFEQAVYLKFIKIKKYFDSFNRQASKSTLFANELSTDVDDKGLQKVPGNSQFWMAIFENNRQLREEAMKHANREWPDYSQEDQERDWEKQSEWVNKSHIYKDLLNKLPQPLSMENKKLLEESDPGVQPETGPLVNLSDMAKLSMLMEERSVFSCDNSCSFSSVLRDFGYGYLGPLREITYLCHEWMNTWKRPPLPFRPSTSRVGPKSCIGYVQKNGSIAETASSALWQLGLADYRPFSNRTYNNLFKQGRFQRGVVRWGRGTAEANALATAQSDPFFNKVDRILSEWKLSPQQLITEMEGELHRFCDSDIQTLFLRLFLRSPVSKKGTPGLGAGKLLIGQDKSLYNSCKQFIARGVSHFSKISNSNSGASNVIEKVCRDAIKDSTRQLYFFLELAFYVAKYLKDGGLYIDAKDIFSMENFGTLFHKDLNAHERAILHFHRLLLYSNYNTDELKEKQLQEIYVSWVACNCYSDMNKQCSPNCYKFVKTFVNILTTKTQNRLQAEPKIASEICRHVLESTGIRNSYDTLDWQLDPVYGFPVYTITLGTDKYSVHLINGQVYTPHGSAAISRTDCPWTQQGDFQRLFGEKTDFEYLSLGDSTICFQHPQYGNFRLRHVFHTSGDGSWSWRPQNIDHYSIERLFNVDGKEVWFAYSSTKGEPGYPDILDYDHAFWVPLNQKECGYIGYYSSLDKQIRKYGLEGDGSIVEVDGESGSRLIEGYVVDSVQKSGLNNFDPHVLSFRDDAGSIQKLQFPRYTSVGGNPLVFLRKGQELLWSDNLHYYLPKAMPQGLLGTIPNYLYLNSRVASNPPTIFVPLQPIGIGECFYPNGTVDIKNTEVLVVLQQSQGGEQWGRFQYTVFHVGKAMELIPTTQEASLYLAYIYQSQKKYTQAIHLIRTLSPLDELSPCSEKILNLIIEQRIIEDHPDAKMVALHALLQKFKAQDRHAIHPVTLYDKQEILKRQYNAMGKVYQSLNNVGADARFTREEECYLLKIMLDTCSLEDDVLGTLRFRKRYERLIEEGKAAVQAVDTLATTAQKVEGDCDLESLEDRSSIGHEGTQHHVVDLLSPAASKLNSRPKAILHTFDEWQWLPSLEEAATDKGGYSEVRVANALAWWQQSTKDQLFVTQFCRNSIRTWAGALFLETHKIAKEGTLQIREAWKFRYNLWSESDKKSSSLFNKAMIDVMLTMLTEPRQFPSPLRPGCSHIEKIEFLHQCAAAHDRWREIAMQNGQKDMLWSNLGSSVPKTDTPKRTACVVSYPTRTNYPIPTKSAFDLEHRRVRKPNDIRRPFEINLQESGEHLGQFVQWKEYFTVVALETVDTPAHDNMFRFDETLLSSSEQPYTLSLKRDLERLAYEYRAGKKIHQDVKKVTIPESDLKTIGDQVNSAVDLIAHRLSDEMRIVVEKANRLPEDEVASCLVRAKIGGGVQKALSFDDCIDCLLSLDCAEYKRKNPQIHDQKLSTEIAQDTLKVLDLKSHLAQLQRVQKLVQDISQIEDEGSSSRPSLLKQLYAEIDAKHDFSMFDFETHLILRIFSAQTGIIPHEKQRWLIRKMLELSGTDSMRFKDIVIQLIMGGGKTAVLATVLLYIAARREGRLALFIVPPALYNTVKSNLRTSLTKAFHTELEACDISKGEITDYRLERLVETFAQARRRKHPIITTPTSIQSLELQLLCQARSFRTSWCEEKKAQSTLSDLQKELRKLKLEKPATSIEKARCTDAIRIQQRRVNVLQKSCSTLANARGRAAQHLLLLRTIVQTLSESADALIDEVDLVLDCRHEVNFPSGSRMGVKLERNSLLLSVYKALVSDSIKITTLEGAPSVNDVVGLTKNAQSTLDKDRYLTHVVPAIATHLYDDFEIIHGEICGFKEPFLRYVSGTTRDQGGVTAGWGTSDIFLQEAADKAFLSFLNDRYEKGNDKQKEMVNLIALLRHFLIDLIPGTLTKSGKRDYGVKPDDHARIIPFLAVNTPATTEFGYHWEEACYYYQWAAASLPSEKQIFEMADHYNSMARYYIEMNGEQYDQTAEFNEFRYFFNVRLDEIHAPGKIANALNYLEEHIEIRLDLQFANVAQYVTYNTERLTSNGAALIDQIASRRAMSGTPWNVEGYAKSLKERFEPDLGTEGQVLYALCKKQPKRKIWAAELSSIEAFMDTVFKSHPTPQKIRGIIETGGLFKAFQHNWEVAKAIVAYIDKNQALVDPDINGVLFFHTSPSEDQPDTLYLWKRGARAPELIGGTTAANFKAKGLESERFFIYYDERHTTGTDLPQPPDTINLVTYDTHTLRRTLTQGIMRLRQFLDSQDVEIVVAKGSEEYLLQGGQTLSALLLHAERTQSIKKAHDMVRYYLQQIDNIFRHIAIVEVIASLDNLAQGEGRMIEIISALEPFFINILGDEPYLQFGKLREQIDTKQYLLNYLAKQLERFSNAVQRVDSHLGLETRALPKAKEAAALMEASIKMAEGLPKTWAGTSEDIGVEQEVEVQQQVEHRTELADHELAQELCIEKEQYQIDITSNEYQQETKMTSATLRGIIQVLSNKGTIDQKLLHQHRLTSIVQQLSSYSYQLGGERICYEKAFSHSLFGTRAFLYTAANHRQLPVFHKLQKPAKQILAVQAQDDTMHWLFLAERETKSVYNLLNRLYTRNHPLVNKVWLIQPNGQPLLEHTNASAFPKQDEHVIKGLLEINAFNGDAEYLSRNRRQTTAWLAEGDRDIKVRFLRIKCSEDKKQNGLLQTCLSFCCPDDPAIVATTQPACKARLERDQEDQRSLKPRSEMDAKLLSPKQVKTLNVEYVKYLGIDVNATDSVTQAAIEKVGTKDPQVLTMEQFNELDQYQIRYLEPSQIQWLPPNKVQYLTKKEQFCTFKNVEGTEVPDRFLLNEAQVAMLQPNQRQFIGYVNPDYYKALPEPWFIMSVPPEHIGKLPLESWQHLSKEQAGQLTDAEVEKLQASGISPARYSWVSGDLIEKIPHNYLYNVTKEQIKEIRNSQLIPKLEEIAARGSEGCRYPYTKGLWSSWIAPQMVQYINFSTQLEYLLERELIAAVPVEQVQYLNATTQVPLIGQHQVQALLDSQLKYCPDDLIRSLPPEKIKCLNDQQYPFLYGHEQIQAVHDQEKFALFTAAQMEWVSDDQLTMVTQPQIQGLSIAQLLALARQVDSEKWQALQEGLSATQIRSIKTKEQLQIFSWEQICNHIETSQLPLLDQDQIASCPEHLVQGLRPDQLAKYNKCIAPARWDEFIKKISAAQISDLYNAGFSGLLQPDQISTHLKSQVSKIQPPPQTQFLEEQVKVVKPQAQIDGLQKHQLEEAQLAHLPKQKVQEITDIKVLEKLPVAKLTELAYAQFLLLAQKDGKIVQQLSSDQVSQLQAKDEGLMAHLLPAQVPALKGELLCKLPHTPAVLNAVESDRLHYLTIAQIKVRNLSNKWLVAKHVSLGILKTLAMPCIVVTHLVINIAKTLFLVGTWLFFSHTRDAQRRLLSQLKITFIFTPAIDLCACVAIFHPAKYLQLQSYYTWKCKRSIV